MASEAIAAIATPPGRGGIGVVRVSGARLVGILRALTGKEIAPRYATRADFLDAGGGIIDQGLALYFPAPHSYTGEDVFELQAHGGPVVLQQLLRRCLELGARVAEPGEFTKRAFLNDKLDLAQAESVADLIDASTSAAARCAVRSLQGEFSRRIQTMVDALTDLRMLVEATLDFPEEDTATLAHETVGAKIDHIRGQLGAVLAASRQGSLLRAGLHIVIAGQPNVGKSSLVNRLAGEEVAIVSEIPGTTRDVIRQSIEIHGVPLHILDTAGLRESGDPLETIGISRAWENIAKADMVLWVSDATRPLTRIKDLALMERIPKGVPQIRVTNKTDLAAQNPRLEELPISAKTGAGIEALKNEILKAAGGHPTSEDAFLARERHLRALLEAAFHLEQAACCTNRPELVAEELRLAQAALGNITGEFTSDDLLGQIFSRFCIGK